METLTHIALADDWAEAEASGSYPWSTRGMTIEQVGYLHASFPEQVAATRDRFYADLDAPLVLLTLDPERIEAAGLRVVVEPADPNDPSSERFPHVYGGPLPVGVVTQVRPLSP